MLFRSQSWNSKGVFLRGNTSSGVFENDSFQGHYHEIWGRDGGSGWHGVPQDNGYNGPLCNLANPFPGYWEIREATNDGTNGAPRKATETRPANFSVVWILRVK